MNVLVINTGDLNKFWLLHFNIYKHYKCHAQLSQDRKSFITSDPGVHLNLFITLLLQFKPISMLAIHSVLKPEYNV